MKRFLMLFLIVALVMPFFGVQPATAARPVGNGMIDTWVFVDNDRNGIYSSGDEGLTGVVVCLRNTKTNWNSCVGTDQGDTWWEDLSAGRYAATVDNYTVPLGYQLNSIQCFHTSGQPFKCDTYKSTWRAYAKMKNTTRINIFFALVPISR